MPALNLNAPDAAFNHSRQTENLSSLQLAFELAASGAFEQVGGIEEALRRAGHDISHFETAAFRKQLRQLMKLSRLPIAQNAVDRMRLRT